MSWYSKYIIITACIGLVGIPIFVFDLSDISWENNKELYWGMIALFAMIGAVLIENRARIIQKKMDQEKKKKKD